MREILLHAGKAAVQPYRDTSLDFAEDLSYTSTEFPLNHIWGKQKRPLPRIPNDRDSLLHSWTVVLTITFSTSAFTCLQFIAWNFTFASRSEQLLWRYTCVSNLCLLGTVCSLEVANIVASNYTRSGLHTFNDYKLKWPTNLLFLIPGALYFVGRSLSLLRSSLAYEHFLRLVLKLFNGRASYHIYRLMLNYSFA